MRIDKAQMFDSFGLTEADESDEFVIINSDQH